MTHSHPIIVTEWDENKEIFFLVLILDLGQQYSLGYAVPAAKKESLHHQFLWQPFGCFKSNPEQNLRLCSLWCSQILAKRPAVKLASSRDDKLIHTCRLKPSCPVSSHTLPGQQLLKIAEELKKLEKWTLLYLRTRDFQTLESPTVFLKF